jgi:S-adenosylmethionine:tRNA-ribosyltransferase-isomerase (queuine synthetase)
MVEVEKIILFFLAGFFLYIFIDTIILFFKLMKVKKRNKQKMEELIKNKCKTHKWITMKVEGKETHVCRECCFAPMHDSFVKEFYVKEAISKEKFEINYKKFLDEKIEELSKEYGIKPDIIKEIGEKVEKTKQEYSVVYLQQILKDLGLDKDIE